MADQGAEGRWKLEGVETPHDLAIVAAPVRLAGSERPLAVLVSETRMSGSKLHKFILLPDGEAYLFKHVPAPLWLCVRYVMLSGIGSVSVCKSLVFREPALILQITGHRVLLWVTDSYYL